MISPTVERTSTGAWLFTWAPGTPPYAVWLDGFLLSDQVEEEEYEYFSPAFESFPPDLEVLNAGEEAGNSLHPPYMILQWRGVRSAAGYVVEQEISSGSWTSVATVRENQRGYYSWTSPPLNDEETYTYRVKAVDLQGNEGAAVEFTFEMVRHPARPAVTIDIATSGDVVVS